MVGLQKIIGTRAAHSALSAVFRIAFRASIVGLACAPLCEAEVAVLRELPYPFSHMISIANDADGQPPWYTHALHTELNGTLGLRIGDSFWVATNSNAPSAAALMTGPHTVNNTDSGVDGLNTFWFLVRRYHRGDIDHLHSWQDDAIHRYRVQPAGGISLKQGTTRVALPRSKLHESRLKFSTWPLPPSLRLYFDGPIPDNASIRFVTEEGKIEVPESAVQRSSSMHEIKPPQPYLEVLLTEVGDEASALRGIPGELEIDSSADATINRIEWDGFSRSIVERQAPVLKRMNIRPVLTTAHGGYTRAQNLGKVDMYQLPPAIDEELARVIDWEARAGGDDIASHAFHVDVLRRIGVHSAAAIPAVDYPYNAAGTAALRRFETAGLWNVHKTWGLSLRPPLSRKQLQDAFSIIDPIAARARTTDHLCTTNLLCLRSEQGPTVGFQLATSLAHVNGGRSPTTHLWYQHLGSALAFSPTKRSLSRPFSGKNSRAFRKLAEYAYNVSGRIPITKRVWVPSASVWQTYLITTRNLKNKIFIERDAGAIEIVSVRDPVLNRPWPLPNTGTRELHGLTIYVPDANAVKINLNGREISSYTRNPPDQTGRPSITIVNDQYPITIFNRFLAADGGRTMTTNSRQIGADSPVFKFVTDGARPRISFSPENVRLDNVSHLRIRAKKSDPGDLWIRLTMSSGTRLLLYEGTSPPSTERHADLRIPRLKVADWEDAILSVAELRFVNDHHDRGSIPLPTGKVEEIEVGVVGFEHGQTLEIESISALQEIANFTTRESSVVVAGRVTDSTMAPVSQATVRLNEERGSSTKTRTDSGGYFVFSDIRPHQGIVLSVHADVPDTCQNFPEKRVWLSRNEVETDFVAAQCD